LHLLLLPPHLLLCPVCAAVNFAQGGSIFWAFVIGFYDMPLTAMQVLYVNLVTAVTMGEL
jgi:hypothetical protein